MGRPVKDASQKYKDKSESRKKSNANLIPFKSGYDARRNYHGRPKDHDELRALIRDVAAEISQDKKYSRVYEKIVRMFDSRDPRDSVAMLEHGWGKVPDKLEINDSEYREYHVKLKAFLDNQSTDPGTDNSSTEPEGGSQ